MNCPVCGMPVEKGAAFCPSCGTNMNIAGYTPRDHSLEIPAQYKPLSPWAYIGYSILFAIPLIGLICLIVFSFNSNNLNRRNYARSYWCAILIALIIVIAVSIIAAATGTTEELINALESITY